MASDCIDICDLVCSRLEALGFDLGPDGDHEPIIDALTQVEFVRKTPTYYVLHVWGDVDPILSDPYTTEEERDKAAKEWKRERLEEDGDDPGGFYAIDSSSTVEVSSYSGAFFEDDEEEDDDSNGWINDLDQGDIVTFTGREGTDQAENHTGPIQFIEEVDDDLWHVVFTNYLDIQAHSDELSQPDDEEEDGDE